MKNNKGIIVALVISVVIIIGLVGFICYDKGIIFGSHTAESQKQ